MQIDTHPSTHPSIRPSITHGCFHLLTRSKQAINKLKWGQPPPNRSLPPALGDPRLQSVRAQGAIGLQLHVSILMDLPGRPIEGFHPFWHMQLYPLTLGLPACPPVFLLLLAPCLPWVLGILLSFKYDIKPCKDARTPNNNRAVNNRLSQPPAIRAEALRLPDGAAESLARPDFAFSQPGPQGHGSMEPGPGTLEGPRCIHCPLGRILVLASLHSLPCWGRHLQAQSVEQTLVKTYQCYDSHHLNYKEKHSHPALCLA